jgi:hypothetical protein
MAYSPIQHTGRVPKCAIEKEFEKKRAYDVVFRMESEKYSIEVCEWGARGFASIAGLAMHTQNAESFADFLDDGGCEALVQIMNKYAESSEVVAAYGCLAISVLAWSLRELKEFLGEIGACEIVVFALSMHIGSPLVSEYGTRAVGILAQSNISNSFRIAEAGACDALAQAGNFGFNLRHDRCVEIATNVCLGFAELSEAANCSRLLDCGATALVVELTRFHHKQEDFARSSIKAICALSSLNAIHREELGRCAVCPLVVKMLYLHEITSLILEGCEAIMHLSLSPNNANILGENGGCEVVVNMLRTKLFNVEMGAEVCTGAMLNLATYGENARINREKFIQVNAIELLRKTQFSSKASYKARENIVSLLDLLSIEIENNHHHHHHHVSSSAPVGGGGVSGSGGGGGEDDMTLIGTPINRTRSSSNNSNSTTNMNGNNNNNNNRPRLGSKTSNSNSNNNSSSNNNNSNHHYHHHHLTSSNLNGELVSIIHGSAMKGDTIPLTVEVREVRDYIPNSSVPFQQRKSGAIATTTITNGKTNHHHNHHRQYSPSPDEITEDETDDVPSNNGMIEL